jgi:Tfp pilus assembly protein PilN
MLNFNLLPKEKREEIKKEKIFLFLVGILKVAILSLLIIFTIILSIYFSLVYLSYSQKAIFETAKNNPNIKSALLVEEKIKNINNLLNDVSDVQSKIVYLAPVIERISSLLPEGTYLTELNIERKVEGQNQGNQGTSQGETLESQASPSPTSSSVPTSQEFQIKKEYIEVNIKGVAKERQDVILLEERLRSQKDFTNLVVPPANLLKAKEADFEFTFRLKE